MSYRPGAKVAPSAGGGVARADQLAGEPLALRPTVLDGVGGFIESPKLYPYLSGRKNLEGLARLDGLDSLLSIVQMPAGIPVATMAIGGGTNAGLMAARIVAIGDPSLTESLDEHERGLRAATAEKNERLGDV